MGLDYEYHLYFPRDEMWNVLESVAAMAAPVGETKIILPNREIVLPFTVRFKNETIVFDESVKQLNFDTSLWFTNDEYIERDLHEGYPDAEVRKKYYDEKNHVRIGYIYLRVIPDSRNSGYKSRWKPNICCFEFAAATTSMSLLFEDSISIKRALKRLLKKHKGFGGHLFDSDYVYHAPSALWPPDMSVREMLQTLIEPEESDL